LAQVDRLPVERRVVDLKVAGMHDQPRRRVDGVADRVGNGVVHVEGLRRDRAEREAIPRLHGMQRHFLGEAARPEAPLDQPARQRRGVDRRRNGCQQVGQRPDVILVAVREQNATHLVPALHEVGKVGDHKVDPRHVIAREHQPRIDDDDVLRGLQDEAVSADLLEAPEGQYT